MKDSQETSVNILEVRKIIFPPIQKIFTWCLVYHWENW